MWPHKKNVNTLPSGQLCTISVLGATLQQDSEKLEQVERSIRGALVQYLHTERETERENVVCSALKEIHIIAFKSFGRYIRTYILKTLVREMVDFPSEAEARQQLRILSFRFLQ